MRTLLVLVALVAPASADRKEAGPDVPPLSEVARIDLELGAGSSKCQPLTWSIQLDLVAGTWSRTQTRCAATGKPLVSKSVGRLDNASRTTLAARYADLRMFAASGGNTVLTLTLWLRWRRRR